MKKNSFKIKNHFANLSKLVLMVLFISVFTEVNAQSTSKTTNTPAAVQPTDPAAKQGTLQVAPEPVAADAVVNELKTTQPEPGTINATTVMPASPAAAPAAVQPDVAPAAQPSQQKKQTDKKQPK